MMMGNFRLPAVRLCLLLVIFFHVFAGKSQPGATLTGTITNYLNGSPLIGAKISVGNNYTYSVIGGLYNLSITPTGTFPVICSKPGFENYSSVPVLFLPSVNYPMNISLLEARNPPGTTIVHLDTSGTSPVVPVQWDVPHGIYDLLYDDGIQDNFTVWSTQGNMNAVKITPLAYPAIVKGGMINIGISSNYPAGSNPFVPFQVSVYDASGPGGKPGSMISGPEVVIPNTFGWIDFTFSNPPVINNGNFYIVMIQGGNAPNASGLAIDETTPQFRSYFRFTSGTGSWMPAAGNFLIRTLIDGTGGPPGQDKNSFITLGYNLWRLKQGEELNMAVWSPLPSTNLTHSADSSWMFLPCSPYRWGVQARYPGNRLSDVTFSNVLGKCWTTNVSVHVTLSCDSASSAGTKVIFKNLVYPDTLYSQLVVNSSGDVAFSHFWKGSYELKVIRFGYNTVTRNVSLNTDTVLQVLLLQEKTPPSDLVIHDSSLMATWRRPNPQKEIFSETWESGSFTANEWTLQGGTNWLISSTSGNPQPSAMFAWSPHVINYEQSLVSKSISGVNASLMKLRYDIYLDNHGTTTLNQLAVELWDGTTWQTIQNYSNSSGDIHWTSQELDISGSTNSQFKIRFRAYGADSEDINNWNIDNIYILCSELPSVSGNCVLGYNFFLDNILCSFLHDTTYTIPPNLVHYGNTSTACVNAVYGSGPSYEICTPFTSDYLPPPINLQGIPMEQTIFLTWNKPQAFRKTYTPPAGLMGYIIYRDGILVDSISSPDTLSYFDFNLFPGIYSYGVSALYNLTSYGFPGMIGESLPAGPVEVTLAYGPILPFFEPWDQGSFAFNSWSFNPDQGNWKIITTEGDPLPCAEFSSEPVRTNYSFSMESCPIGAPGVTCSKVWLDFSDRLQDSTNNSTEKLTVELFNNNRWSLVYEEKNSGSTGWTNHHIDVTPVSGKTFKFRFRANGENSGNIIRWQIDNISIYAVCKPATNLAGDAEGLDVHLTWSSPVCPEGYPLNEGFEETQFPPNHWSQNITNQSATWIHSDLNSPIGVHTGTYAARVPTDYNHQDEWLIAENVAVTGDLVFWSFGFQGSVHNDHYFVKLSEDHGSTWEILLDLSTLPPYPGTSGYNQWNQPYTINLSSYFGEVVDLAWQVVDGDGQGVWYTWAIDDCKVGDGLLLTFNNSASSQYYDIYRQDEGSDNFTKINQGLYSDTTYTDPGLAPSSYRYYVAAFQGSCYRRTSSDTIVVDVITGNNEMTKTSQLNIFPNPAKDILSVVSNSQIQSVEILDYLGKTVFSSPNIEKPCVSIPVANFPPGIYILKATTLSGPVNKKVIIEH
jgi:hypothetical protein